MHGCTRLVDEAEAKATALKHVENLLQRPDQLEKVEQYKKRASRKQASVEAMLKTTVQSQLEGVKMGLSQLQTAVEDLQAIKQSMGEIDELFISVTPLKTKLSKLKDESIKHSQYAAAMENLKHIFNVPETIEATKEYIADEKLLHAHKHLMDLENARDDLLFEMFKLQSGSQHEMNLLKAYFSDVEKLIEGLAKKVFHNIGRVLDALREEASSVVTALRIIEREERIDKFCIDRHRQSGFMPQGRPREWRKKCFAVLRDLVETRIHGYALIDDASGNRQWLAISLERCRKSILDDLRTIKSMKDAVFPQDYDIFVQFVKMYHKCLSVQLRDIASRPLEKNELVQLLSWLKVYRSDELLLHPSLLSATEYDAILGAEEPLLPSTTETMLTNAFAQMIDKDLKLWLDKALAGEQNDWHNKIPPECDSSNYFYTPMPQILFQMLDDQVQLVKEIGDDKIPKILKICVEQFVNFAQEYRRACQTHKLKHLGDRSLYQNAFTGSMIAAANNCTNCIDLCEKIKRHTRARSESDVLFSPRSNPTVHAAERAELMKRIDELRDVWHANVAACVNCLLEEVIDDLKAHLATVLSSAWLNNSPCVKTICMTLEDYYHDHVHLKPAILNQLLTDLQIKIFGEYVRAFEARRITFHSYDERKKCAELLNEDNAALVKKLEHFIHDSGADVEILKDIVPAIASLLELRDQSLLTLEVSSFVQKFRDITPEQLSSLINLREDTSKSESKQIAEEIFLQYKHRQRTAKSPYKRLFIAD